MKFNRLAKVRLELHKFCCIIFIPFYIFSFLLHELINYCFKLFEVEFLGHRSNLFKPFSAQIRELKNKI